MPLRSLLLRVARTAVAAGLVAACGGGLVLGDFDCEDEVAVAVDTFGPPATIDERTESEFHIRTFWYPGEGLVLTFRWSSQVACVREDRVVRR